jgi:DNA polymerase delta subunit 1
LNTAAFLLFEKTIFQWSHFEHTPFFLIIIIIFFSMKRGRVLDENPPTLFEELGELNNTVPLKKATHSPPPEKAKKSYNVYDPNDFGNPDDPNVDELVYEEELLDEEDALNAVDPMFLRAHETISKHAEDKKKKRFGRQLETVGDLEDFYGEEPDELFKKQEEDKRFNPNWDFHDASFRVKGQPAPSGAHLRPEIDQNVGTGDYTYYYQHTETTYALNEEGKPEIRHWGVDADGHSVLTRVKNFYPYFYFEGDEFTDIELIRKNLELHLSRTVPNRRGQPKVFKHILHVAEIEGRSICGYHKDEPLKRMFRMIMARPSFVAIARKSLDYGNRAVVSRSYPTYEANVPFELRYMVDTNLYGCQWTKLLSGRYERVDEDSSISNAQYEFVVDHLKKPLEPVAEDEREAQKLPPIGPMRLLSYDIEVFRKEAGFPTPDKNPVVNICCALSVTGKGIVDRVVFVLKPKLADGSWGTHNPIPGSTVYEFEDERHLLLAFSQYIQDCDPDGLTGWNTSSFDMPYLAGRAKANNILEHFMSFSRIRNKTVWLRERIFQSKAYGAKKNTELVCEGRFDFDGLIFMLRGQMKKYRSYTLNNIASEVLKDTKLDVDYSQIPILYESEDDADRTRLAHYCLKDSELPLQILDKLMAVVDGVEQARVTGVTFKWLLSKGQGVKTFSKLLRDKEQNEYVPTLSPRSSTGDTAGGYVEEPRRGWYPMPVITLDFSSLYPSIMIAYNICYSTKVSRRWAKTNLKDDDYWSPFPAIDGGKETDFVFVKKHIREGILPKMLDGLLSARRNVKGMMKKVDENLEALLHSVLNGRQMALKVVCNSVYGFLKAFILRDKDLMSAVTSYGRNMIYKVKEVIERDFQDREVIDVEACEKLGIDPEVEPKEGEKDLRPLRRLSAFIVYGDTDSVMVCFGDLEGKKKNRPKPKQQSLHNLWGKRERIEVEYDKNAPRSAGSDAIEPKYVILRQMIELGKEMAAKCTAEFEAPNSLTFETIKLRGGWLNKKRYFALEIEKFFEGERMVDAIKRASISVKGLEGKRRDNAFINSATQNECIRILLKENDIPKIERFIVSRITDLLMGRVDISELVITKGLSKTDEQYAKGGSKQQHVELKKRMAKRSKFTGEVVPDTGDRVPFIIKAASNNKKSSKGAEKASELSEHPLFAQRNGVPINTHYYINKQIWPAVSRIMTCVYEPERCPDIKSAMGDKKKETLKVYKRFFAPGCEHMRNKKQKTTGDFGIGKHTHILPKCLGCGSRLKNPDAACCDFCGTEKVRQKLETLKTAQEQTRDAAWDICRKCQGGSFNKVTCSNLTCKNFFHREQTLIDMEDLCTKLKRFN